MNNLATLLLFVEADAGVPQIGVYKYLVWIRNQMENKENFFEKFGLEVTTGDVEIGQTYPIYGMITKVLSEAPGSVIVEINFSIRATMTVPDSMKIELLKERAFEPGIFVSTVTSKDDAGLSVDCQTVVFGKKQDYAA